MINKNVSDLLLQINLILLYIFNFNSSLVDYFNSKLNLNNNDICELKEDSNLILFEKFNFGLDKLKLFNSELISIGDCKNV